MLVFSEVLQEKVYGAFLPSVGKAGWFTTVCLKLIAEQRILMVCVIFHMTRDKSYNALVMIDTTARYRSVLSRLPIGPTTRLWRQHWLCWTYAVRSPWLYRLPDRPQGHGLYPKKSLHVRMWNIRYSVERGTAFRLSEKYSYAYVFIRIRAYVQIIRCFPEPQKISENKLFGTSGERFRG